MLMSKRVLLVDDEDDIREVAQVSLEMVGGWTIYSANCGAKGIEVAAQEQPDAILLDVMMPDMDGPTTFQKLQQRDDTKHIPVILLTAKVQASDKARFQELGVSGLIAKPFDPMTLADTVSQKLGW